MSGQLILQLAASSVLVLATVLIHLGGVLVMIRLMRHHYHHRDKLGPLGHEVVAVLGAAAVLFFLHGVEIWTYALFYTAAHATRDFEEALYFSTVTYTTIGYTGSDITKAWRVLGAIEGANGIILLTWSAAFFVAIVSRMRAMDSAWFTDGRRDAAGLDLAPPPSETPGSPN
jgi:voltage-gated potassium channel